MTDGLCEETELGFILAVLLQLQRTHRPRTNQRAMDLPLPKGNEMTATIPASPKKLETALSRLEEGGGRYEIALVKDAASELAALRAESESRRVALEQKSEECLREWTRAENAEAALEEAKVIISVSRAIGGNGYGDYETWRNMWLQKYGGQK